MKGPWTPAGKLPASFDKLPADENWKDVKATLPGQKVNAKDVPKVFVSLEPAELILLQGKPNYLTVAGRKAAPVGEQHRQRRLSDEPHRRGLFPRGGPVVFGA